jgi:alkylation response protein AidB-like acyl-CoA dehydrogenase
MNFDFSEEEQQIKSQARRLLADRALHPMVRRLLDGGESSAADALWREVAALGWPATMLPEEHGGLDLGGTALCAIAEEIGRACAPLPMFPSIYLAAEAVRLFGSDRLRDGWLPKLAAGETIGTAMLGGSTSLQIADDHLNGRVSPVAYGLSAGLGIFLAREQDGASSLIACDCGHTGVRRHPVVTIDLSVPHAAMAFDMVPVERLGAAGGGKIAAARLQAGAAVLLAFEQLGGADACLDMALAYAKQRRSFGRLIGSYQAIKHRLVEMYVKNELARSHAYYAAWALCVDGPELERAAASARVSATEAFEFAASENLHVHGGMGFTWEADPHLYYRRARLLSHTLGPVSAWQRRLAAALGREHSAGGKVACKEMGVPVFN